MTETMHRDYAALVGWTVDVAGDRLTLRLQGVTTPPPHQAGDVHSHFYFMDRQQALRLANYLFEMLNETKPDKSRRSRLARMFG